MTVTSVDSRDIYTQNYVLRQIKIWDTGGAKLKKNTLPFFVLQSYACVYKIEYLISKVTHFIKIESENYYLYFALWDFKT